MLFRSILAGLSGLATVVNGILPINTYGQPKNGRLLLTRVAHRNPELFAARFEAGGRVRDLANPTVPQS